MKESKATAAKTDKLDSKALAQYGYERHDQLEIFVPQSKLAIELFQLTQRLSDLAQMLVAEKNRFKSPSNYIVQSSCKKMIGKFYN